MPFDFPTNETAILRQNRAGLGLVNHLKGMAAEQSVISACEAKGCHLVARRWRGQAGEIDLIFSQGPILIFVEVKASRDFAAAA